MFTTLPTVHLHIGALGLALAAAFSLTACGGDDSGSPMLIAPTMSVAAVTFGSTPINSSAAQTVVVTNTNATPISIATAVTSTNAAGGSFSTAGCDAPIPAGASCSLTVTYLPSAANLQATADLSVSLVASSQTAAGGLQQTLPLKGSSAYASPSGLMAFAAAAPGVALESISPSTGVARVALTSIPELVSMNNLVADANPLLASVYTLGYPGSVSTVYTIDAVTGGVKSAVGVPLQVQAIQAGAASGHVLAMSYNVDGTNSLVDLEAATGRATASVALQFSGGGWVSFATHVKVGRAYVLSADNSLYTFDLATLGQPHVLSVDATHPLQSLQPGQGGVLVGVARNDVLSAVEIVSIDASTGALKVLSTFNFSSNSWMPSTLVSELSSNTLYAVSGDGMLYEFDLTTGALRATVPMPTGYSFGVLQVGSKLGCPAGSVLDSAHQQCAVN